MEVKLRPYPEATDNKFIIRNQLTGKIRGSFLFYVLSNIYHKCFDFFWLNFMHLPERVQYLFSSLKEKSHDLRRKGIVVVENDSFFINTADNISKHITPKMIEDCKKLLASKQAEPDNYNNAFASLETTEEIDYELFKLALDDKVLGTVSNYFGFIPKLGSVSILYNDLSIYDKPIGSQLWHRDGGQYRSCELFLYLKNIDETNGAFSAIGFDKIAFNSVIMPSEIDLGLPKWVQGRIDNDQMLEFVDKNEITTAKGPKGTACFVDTGSNYHKGGHCTKEDRLVVHISFYGENENPRPSCLDYFQVRSNQKIMSLIDSKEKQIATSAYENEWLMKIKAKTYTLGKRYNCYLQPFKTENKETHSS